MSIQWERDLLHSPDSPILRKEFEPEPKKCDYCPNEAKYYQIFEFRVSQKGSKSKIIKRPECLCDNCLVFFAKEDGLTKGQYLLINNVKEL